MELEQKVELINFTPNPEETVALAMRQSRYKGGISSLKLTNEEVKRLCKLAIDLGHFSVFEHISFTFAIEGISRSCSHQFVRHRFFSFTQQSQRYVKEMDFPFIVPPSIKQNKEAYDIFIKTVEEISTSYGKLAKFVPIEDARFILPNAAETKIVATANARELMHFFKLRMAPQAQWEIRNLANLMFKKVATVCQNIFNEYNIGNFE
jgi:thymidylate synthase (FAD)